jgi:hypothetical protein
MEASNGSSIDGKPRSYGDAILTHWKHPVAVSTKPEAPDGSKYKTFHCLRLLAADSFPFRLQSHRSHSFLHRTTLQSA